MSIIIRIKVGSTKKLLFQVESSSTGLLASSAPFDSICRLESALATLAEAATYRSPPIVEREARSTVIRLNTSRKRVCFEGIVSDSKIQELLAGVKKARLVDDRPVERRRTDLNGRLCDLSW